MEYIAVVLLFVLVFTSYMAGKGSANGYTMTLKRENERLNAELLKLTDRDERGRFTGNKSK